MTERGHGFQETVIFPEGVSVMLRECLKLPMHRRPGGNWYQGRHSDFTPVFVNKDGSIRAFLKTQIESVLKVLRKEKSS